MPGTTESGRDRRVMIDVETLGLEPGSVILSIGAVEFGPGEMGRTFYTEISRESCVKAGLTVDADTLDWWEGRSEDAQSVLEGGDELVDALEAFRDWMAGVDEVWANSPSFDCEMLIEAGKAVGVPMPWEYYHERDFRTLHSLPQAPEAEGETAHHALDDATEQARIAATTLKRLDAAAVEAER